MRKVELEGHVFCGTCCDVNLEDNDAGEKGRESQSLTGLQCITFWHEGM